MKKITYKTIPAKPAKPESKKKVELTYCDVCKQEIKGKYYSCVLCKRDCHGWWEVKGCSDIDERDYGDYPSKYCKFCHNLKFGKYDQEYWQLQSEYEKKEEELDAKILKESLSESSIS